MPHPKYLEDLQRHLKEVPITRGRLFSEVWQGAKYIGVGLLGAQIGNQIGFKRGYEQTLNAVAAKYPPQYIGASDEEVISNFLSRGTIDYLPPTDKRRKVVRLPQAIFPTNPLESLPDFFKAAPAYLESTIDIIAKNENDRNFNPDFSHLYTFDMLSQYNEWNPGTLLTTLRLLHQDISNKGKNVILVEGNEEDNVKDNMMGRSAATFTPLTMSDNNTPRILPSTMSFYPNILSQTYPSLENPNENIPISHIGLLPILVYEYMNRLNAIADVSILGDKIQLFQNYHFTTKEFNEAANDLFRIMHKYGRRYSAENNTVQLGIIRSLAAMAGDPTGKVVGLERSEAWLPRIYQVAALQGDVKALTYLQRILYQSAGY